MTEVDHDHPVSTAECLAAYRDARVRVEAVVGRVTSWTTESDEGWTAKDYLAHLTAWQRRLARWFEEGRAGQFRAGPEPGFTFEQVDALKERDWLASRDQPLEAVQREFGETADAVEALVGSLEDDDLNDAARAPWFGFEARHAIAGNTYGHYDEHLAVLEQLAEATG